MNTKEKDMREEKIMMLENIKKQESTKANTGKGLNPKHRETLIYSFRYVYLTGFFFMLSGIFAPIIKGKNYELPFVGVIILYVGLLGGIFLYESTQTENRKIKYMVVGFALLFLSTAGIYMLVGM